MCQLIKTCGYRSRASVYANIEHKKGVTWFQWLWSRLVVPDGLVWVISEIADLAFSHKIVSGGQIGLRWQKGYLYITPYYDEQKRQKNFKLTLNGQQYQKNPFFSNNVGQEWETAAVRSSELGKLSVKYYKKLSSIASDSCSWLTGLFPIF